MGRTKYLLALSMLLAILGACVEIKMEESFNPYPTTLPTDSLKEAIARLPGVTNVTTNTDGDGRKTIFFSFRQAVDHNDPSAGTFLQRVGIRYAGEDNTVVLNTQGYDIEEAPVSVADIDLADTLHANIVEIEHRYFGKSLPETLTSLEFNYLYTEQAAEDIHTIVKLLKDNLFKTGKWVSTGCSKGGISTVLQAYYSEKKGWKDIDLYVPFCAPFMTELYDRSFGDYVLNTCGNDYPDGSPEAIARERLRRYPAAISGNKDLREACLRSFHYICPDVYELLLNEYGPDEKAATCGAEWCFAKNSSDFWCYLPISLWAPLVPDPDTDAPDLVAGFVFTTVEELYSHIKTSQTQTKGGYNDNELVNQINKNDSHVNYVVQGCRELGLMSFNYSAVDGTYLTEEYAQTVTKLLDDAGRFEKYNGQWDGGALMKDVKAWVETQSSAEMVFVYGANDPWTSGSVNPVAAASNPHVTYILNSNGIHSYRILNRASYDESTCTSILNAVKAVIGK